MSMRQTVQDFLEHEHALYRTVTHRPAFTAQEEAAAARVPGRDWAKTIICFVDEEPVIAVLPAPSMINLEKLRALAGGKRIRLATEQEMMRLYPDCEVGATPPLGPLYKQRVFADQELAHEPEIVFSAGTHTDAVRMPYDVFAAIARPTLGEFGDAPGTPERTDGPGLWG